MPAMVRHQDLVPPCLFRGGQPCGRGPCELCGETMHLGKALDFLPKFSLADKFRGSFRRSQHSQQIIQ